VRNTGDDRFATFFIAIYDSFFANSALHKPVIYRPGSAFCEGRRWLEDGGMVLA